MQYKNHDEKDLPYTYFNNQRLKSKKMDNQIKNSISLIDIRITKELNERVKKSYSCDGLTNKIEVEKSFFNAKTGEIMCHTSYHKDYEIDELISDPVKNKLIHKGIELGFSIDRIKKILMMSEYMDDEEKFFDNLINISIKSDSNSIDLQKGISIEKSNCDEENDYNEENADNNDDDEEEQYNDYNNDFDLEYNLNEYENVNNDEFHNMNSAKDESFFGDNYKLNSKSASKISKQNKSFLFSTSITRKSTTGEINLENELFKTYSVKKNGVYSNQKDVLTETYSQNKNDRNNLRPIIIDGNDVAMYYSANTQFLASRIKTVVDFFEDRGHNVYVIIPSWRKEAIDSDYLRELKNKSQLHIPPSKRLISGKRIDCECDLFMLQLAERTQGIIVSNSDFKKVLNEGDKFKTIIEERVLMYSFISDKFLPVEDPLGKTGPTLDNFLLIETVVYQKICPYRKKCTYGTKCKFYHPERESKKQFKTAHQSVIDEAQENKRHLESFRQEKMKKNNDKKNQDSKSELSDYQEHSKLKNLTSMAHNFNEKQKKNLDGKASQRKEINLSQKNLFDRKEALKMTDDEGLKNTSNKLSDKNSVLNNSDLLLNATKGCDIQDFQSSSNLKTGIFNILDNSLKKTKRNNQKDQFQNQISESLGIVNDVLIARDMCKQVTPSQCVGKQFKAQNNSQSEKMKISLPNKWNSTKTQWEISMKRETLLKKGITKTEGVMNFSNYSYFSNQNALFNTITGKSVKNTFENQPLNAQKSNDGFVGSGDNNQDLFMRLLTRLSEDKARWVLDNYKDETDEDKLVFLAEDKSFFD